MKAIALIFILSSIIVLTECQSGNVNIDPDACYVIENGKKEIIVPSMNRRTLILEEKPRRIKRIEQTKTFKFQRSGFSRELRQPMYIIVNCGNQEYLKIGDRYQREDKRFFLSTMSPIVAASPPKWILLPSDEGSDQFEIVEANRGELALYSSSIKEDGKKLVFVSGKSTDKKQNRLWKLDVATKSNQAESGIVLGADKSEEASSESSSASNESPVLANEILKYGVPVPNVCYLIKNQLENKEMTLGLSQEKVSKKIDKLVAKFDDSKATASKSWRFIALKQEKKDQIIKYKIQNCATKEYLVSEKNVILGLKKNSVVFTVPDPAKYDVFDSWSFIPRGDGETYELKVNGAYYLYVEPLSKTVRNAFVLFTSQPQGWTRIFSVEKFNNNNVPGK